MELSWRKFNALGTELIVAAYLETHQSYLLDKAQVLTFEFDQRFSRFVKSNETSNLNNFGSGEFRASPLLCELLRRCQYYYQETNGLFDPTIIDIMTGIGYDRNFENISTGLIDDDIAEQRLSASRANFVRRPKISELEIDDNLLVVPQNFQIDFGGIGKGFLVDMIAREVFSEIENFWISAGGDLLAKGSDGSKIGWQISVENPLMPDKQSFSFNTLGETLGIATSGIVKRRGQLGSMDWHHIIDPRTAESAKTDAIAVSVMAPSAEAADVYAKTVLISGSVEGLRFIEERIGLECAIFFRDRAPLLSKGLIKYL